MSRRSIQRSIWRSIFKSIENPQKPIFPEWVGWLLIVAVVILFFV